jgi:cyclopropane fatty-acyl-phospholipid synthase-like methyltransferase
LNRYRFKFDSILDAGCGYGYYSFYLARKYPSAIIDAWDLDAGMINENRCIQDRLKLKKLNFVHADLTELSKRNEYDMVISIDVLEAIEDDVKVIKNISNALKKGGHFLLHTPRRNHKDMNDSWKVERPERVREGYTRDEISQLLKEHGFEIIEVIKTFGTFGMVGNKIDSLLPTRYLKLMLSIPLNCINFLDTLTKNKKGQAFLVVARKK